MITAAVAFLAAAASADKLLDSVLGSSSDTPKAPSAEAASAEDMPTGQDADDVRKLREEVAALRQKLEGQMSASIADEQNQPVGKTPKEHIANPATLYLRGGGSIDGHSEYEVAVLMVTLNITTYVRLTGRCRFQAQTSICRFACSPFIG